jgi:hypothetical protein
MSSPTGSETIKALLDRLTDHQRGAFLSKEALRKHISVLCSIAPKVLITLNLSGQGPRLKLIDHKFTY